MNELILVSNVARIDYFKNLDLLVKAAVELLFRGTPIQVLVTGGTSADVDRRLALRRLIPKQFHRNFLITEKLDQDQMFSLFRHLRRSGIFVCTSRYETLGITPLEAALSGVCTISPDLKWVEFSRYLPQKYRYAYSVEGLVGKLIELRRSGDFRSDELHSHLRERISRRLFEESFANCWRKISETAMRRHGAARAGGSERGVAR